MNKTERELTQIILSLRLQLAISTSVLSGQDNTRPEIIVEENRTILRNAAIRLNNIDDSNWWLKLLKPKNYNNPNCFNMLWNQWLHQGYLWGWYSYEFHSKHLKDTV